MLSHAGRDGQTDRQTHTDRNTLLKVGGAEEEPKEPKEPRRGAGRSRRSGKRDQGHERRSRGPPHTFRPVAPSEQFQQTQRLTRR